MGLKIFTLVLCCAFTAHTFSLNKKFHKDDPIATPKLDFGPGLGDLINAVIKNLTANGPVEIIPSLGPLNLTQIIPAIIGEDQLNPLKGTLNLSSIALTGLDGAEIVNSTFNLGGLLSPIKVNFDANLPGVGLGGNYGINALLLGILPVKGQGQFAMSIDITAGGGGDLKALPSLKFSAFDYKMDLRNVDVNFEGLIGSPELSEQINKIINNFIDDLLIPSINSLEEKLHLFINTTITDLLNEIVGEITYQKLLEILNAILNPKP
ncbi:unnamed protein product [Allacma fusca]|uniref:Uncharacterized protein n=1 Tax=Allacma fusca TaxID=39272 RepID=A0A8J2MDG1_9HEXA|nr:unnamed protein product [Allacma fusca]